MQSGEPSQGGIYLSSDGNLYGVQNNGILYKFDPNTYVYTLLNQASGIHYVGGVMMASDNALYGTSSNGGTSLDGTIFKYDLTANTYSTLYSFDGINGASPGFGTLLEVTDGKLYGTTFTGGAFGIGVIFSYDRALNTYTDLYDFDTIHGSYPNSGLIQANDGKLYGMTSTGGVNNFGTIYSYDIATAQYTVIHNFNSTYGSNPKGALFQASNGTLFGTTNEGGLYNLGAAFSYDITTNTYSVLANFISFFGTNPQGDIMEATLLATGIAAEDVSSFSISPNPATSYLTINNGKSIIQSIHIYNVLGEEVLKLERITNSEKAIDISMWNAGVYFLEVETEKGLTSKKFVKE